MHNQPHLYPCYADECVRLSAGLSSVEVYNPKANEWMFVAPMNTRRSSVGVGVVDGEHFEC